MTDEERSLVRAIIKNPADRGLRLIYADWLDEHDEQTPCGACKGKGFFSRRRTGDESLKKNELMQELLARQTTVHGWDRCTACEGKGYTDNYFAVRAAQIRHQHPGGWYCTCTGTPTIKHCHPCRILGLPNRLHAGTIDSPRETEWSLLQSGSWYRAEAGFVTELKLKGGFFMVKAGELFAQYPIERVVTNWVPAHLSLDEARFFCDGSYFAQILERDDPHKHYSAPSSILPVELFRRLAKHTGNSRDGYVTYSHAFHLNTPSLSNYSVAVDDLHAALLSYGREQARVYDPYLA